MPKYQIVKRVFDGPYKFLREEKVGPEHPMLDVAMMFYDGLKRNSFEEYFFLDVIRDDGTQCRQWLSIMRLPRSKGVGPKGK